MYFLDFKIIYATPIYVLYWGNYAYYNLPHYLLSYGFFKIQSYMSMALLHFVFMENRGIALAL